jgi:hypothetical protein
VVLDAIRASALKLGDFFNDEDRIVAAGDLREQRVHERRFPEAVAPLTRMFCLAATATAEPPRARR